MMRCASEQFASRASTSGAAAWVYQFQHLFSDSFLFAKFGLPTICVTEVCHGSELPFVFDNDLHAALNTSFTPEEDILATQMGTYWCNFAKTGNPNVGTPGAVSLPTWPAWNDTSRLNLALNTTILVESSEALCSFWDEIGYDH